jgi:hypothetical protein
VRVRKADGGPGRVIGNSSGWLRFIGAWPSRVIGNSSGWLGVRGEVGGWRRRVIGDRRGRFGVRGKICGGQIHAVMSSSNGREREKSEDLHCSAVAQYGISV